MKIVTRMHEADFPIYTLTSGDDEIVISAFGAQILSWTKAGVPIVFENRERAVIDGKTPYRGGAPICFPHFGQGTLLPLGTTLAPQHGRARTTVWDATTAGDLVLTTVQPADQGYGPTEFSCELRYSLSDAVRIQATVHNDGACEAPFQFAIHTYWATQEPSKATVTALGCRYLDNLLGLTEQSEPDSSLPHQTPVDRVYLDAEAKQELLTEHYRVEVETQGCSGAVLWNPGANHHIEDLGSPDFICLESGVIMPGRPLAPGEAHQIHVKYGATIR